MGSYYFYVCYGIGFEYESELNEYSSTVAALNAAEEYIKENINKNGVPLSVSVYYSENDSYDNCTEIASCDEFDIVADQTICDWELI